MVAKFFLLMSLLSLILACLCSENLNANSDGYKKEQEDSIELIDYRTPRLSKEKVFLYESFDDKDILGKQWTYSQATKDNSEMKYDGNWDVVQTSIRIKDDKCLAVKSKAKHHAISHKLDKIFEFTGDNFIFQYDVQFRNGQECGGAYIKLLSSPSGDLTKVNDQTPYSIMFGPDKCGNEYKLHFIFKHLNKKDGNIREIHWKNANSVTHLNDIFADKKWHNFRLVITPDNNYEIEMDRRSVAKGSLFEDFQPPVNYPKEIDDPEDVKPDDWDDQEKIPDPNAVKPDDWNELAPKKIPDKNAKKPDDWLEDENPMIPDTEATKPQNWSEEMDGEWQPPMINNPKCQTVSGCGPWSPPLIDNVEYKGKWMPPMIPNPNYQGKWTPRKIPNPNYFEDNEPYKMNSIDSIAFELWTISNDIVFDNILITNDFKIADNIADSTYELKREADDQMTDNWFVSLIKSTNKQPWLWGIYILALAVPIMLYIGYCYSFQCHKKDKYIGGDGEEKYKLDDVNKPGDKIADDSELIKLKENEKENKDEEIIETESLSSTNIDNESKPLNENDEIKESDEQTVQEESSKDELRLRKGKGL